MQGLGAHPISPEAIKAIKEEGHIVNIVVRACVRACVGV